MTRRFSPATAESIRHLQEEAAKQVKEDVEHLLTLIAMANRLRNQAPEFKPSAAQIRIFAVMRGGKRLTKKQIFGINGVNRRAYSGKGCFDELLELGLADKKGSLFFLTEPGIAMANEWLDNETEEPT